MNFAKIKKAVAGAIGFAVILITSFVSTNSTLIPPAYMPYLTLVVSIAGTYAIWKAKNQTAVKEIPTETLVP